MVTAFDRYRSNVHNNYGGYPMTPFERQTILEPLLKDKIITKSIGLKMLTDDNNNNDLVGLLLAAGGRL